MGYGHALGSRKHGAGFLTCPKAKAMDPFDDFVVTVGPIAARLRRAGNDVDADALCALTARVLRAGEERDGKRLSGTMHVKFAALLAARLAEQERPDEATFRQWMKGAGYSPNTISNTWRSHWVASSRAASTEETGG